MICSGFSVIYLLSDAETRLRQARDQEFWRGPSWGHALWQILTLRLGQRVKDAHRHESPTVAPSPDVSYPAHDHLNSLLVPLETNRCRLCLRNAATP